MNGDTLAGALATSATGTTGVGTAAITQGSLTASANYSSTYVGANLTITARPITLTADALSRIYGNANPALTYTVGGSGLVNGDTLTGSLATSATASTGVGAIAITQGSLAANANYGVTYVGANLTITARPITLTADAATRFMGQPDPALTYQVTSAGLLFNDTLSGSLTRIAGETPGAYPILVGSVGNPNYQISYVSADLTITGLPPGAIPASQLPQTTPLGASLEDSPTVQGSAATDAVTGGGDKDGDNRETDILAGSCAASAAGVCLPTE